MKILSSFVAAACLSGCVHSLHQVQAGDITPGVHLQKFPLVEARSEQFTVMGFVKSTAYVDDARASLLAACPHGSLEGVTTQYASDLGFFSWTNRIVMKGFCIPQNS